MGDFSDASRTDLIAQQQDGQQKLARVDAEIEGVKSEMAARLSGYQSEAQRLRSALGQIAAELSRREARDAIVPTISDHALLRYIERVYGVDIEAMKAELLTDNVILAIKSGASAVKSTVGTMVIKGNSVVTFLDAEMRVKRKTMRGLRKVDGADDDAESAA